MEILEKPLRLVDKAAAGLVALMLLAITLVLFSNAVARYLAGFTVIGGAEFSLCLMVWMTFIGSYLLVRTRAHVAIDLFANVVSERASIWLGAVIAGVGIVACAYVAMLGYEITEKVFATGQRMSSLPLLRGWFYLPVPIGFGLMTLAFLQNLLASLSGLELPKVSDFGPRDSQAAPAEASQKEI